MKVRMMQLDAEDLTRECRLGWAYRVIRHLQPFQAKEPKTQHPLTQLVSHLIDVLNPGGIQLRLIPPALERTRYPFQHKMVEILVTLGPQQGALHRPAACCSPYCLGCSYLRQTQFRQFKWRFLLTDLRPAVIIQSRIIHDTFPYVIHSLSPFDFKVFQETI